MFNFLRRTRQAPSLRAATVAAATRVPQASHPGAGLPEALRYPAVDPGLPAVPVDALLRSQQALLNRLRRVAAFDAPAFERHCLAPIERLARYVHLLPASSFDHFSGPGGLFRYCLELGVYSRQSAEARFFAPEASAETRSGLEARWRHACFLAGLLTPVPRALSALVVTDPVGRAWPAYLGSLDAWLQADGVDRYHVSWQGPEAPAGHDGAEAAAVLGDIIPKESLAWLNEASSQPVRDVFATALGQQPGGGRSDLADLVAATRQRVLAAEAALRPSRYGRLRIGHHLELHLLDALRHRVASGLWRPSDGAGPLWLGTDGLFLEWPGPADALRHDAVRNGVHGWPLSAFTVADVLGRAGVLAEASPGQWLWRIQLNGPGAGEEGVRTALKLADATTVLGYEAVDPLPHPLAAASAASAPRASPPSALASTHTRPPPPRRSSGIRHDATAGAAAHATQHGQPAPGSPPPAPALCRPMPGPAAPEAPGDPPPTPLAGDDAALFAACRQCLQAHQHHLITPYGVRGVAVSQDLLVRCGADLASMATRLHHRRWLGRGDWPRADARVGLLPFDGVQKPGLVLNPAALEALGWTRP